MEEFEWYAPEPAAKTEGVIHDEPSNKELSNNALVEDSTFNMMNSDSLTLDGVLVTYG
ncbi:hypothetical protein VCO01S_15750 [Vibrio comitans NBRC 102076]|uniref:Uncharacterized protein n=1 Tax=Vibrio comitans NBRC 102076 TaxID=1219078 RepID=A0A4Y3IMT1_9VIBR|nr:hypothetical protein VCO01S_15750 [Vibrio comitans NBRC 102076]